MQLIGLALSSVTIGLLPENRIRLAVSSRGIYRLTPPSKVACMVESPKYQRQVGDARAFFFGQPADVLLT